MYWFTTRTSKRIGIIFEKVDFLKKKSPIPGVTMKSGYRNVFICDWQIYLLSQVNCYCSSRRKSIQSISELNATPALDFELLFCAPSFLIFAS